MAEEKNELAEEVTKIIDHGDLYGNPIPGVKEESAEESAEESPKPVMEPVPRGSKKEAVLKGPDIDLELTDEEEEMLKNKLEAIRAADPFIYR